MAKRPGLQEGTPSASRHEQGSYLPIRCRQKGFLPFSNWTPAAPWVGHTKLPRCQRRFFSSGFLLLPLGFLFFFFLPPGPKGSGGCRGGKGWRWRPEQPAAGLPAQDVAFQGAFACRSFFILSVKASRGEGANFVNRSTEPRSARAG